jgi:hypothetical protein
LTGPACLALAAALAVPPAPAVSVAGTEKTVFQLTHPRGLPDIPDHSVPGWKQEVERIDGRSAVVTVTASARPLRSRSPWPLEYLPAEAGPFLAIAPPEADLRGPALRAAAGSPDAWAASARLVALAGRRVRDVPSPGPLLEQDARTAWDTGRGTCVGRANLAVSLARNAGIPARTAHGIRMDEEPGTRERLSPRILHRWVEVFLPDRGWVPSDPADSIHFLGSSYILLSRGEDRPNRVDQSLKGLEVLVLQREGAIRPADVADPALALRPGDPPVLPNGAARLAGAVSVTGRPGARLKLVGPGGARRLRTDASGHGAFVGLEPGLYRLLDRGAESLLMVSGAEVVRARVR